MTKQENFKRRVRARMETTGERYAAARSALLANARGRSGRTWVSPPEVTSERVSDATGRDWDEWCDLIDAWPGHLDGHTAIARHLQDDHGIDGWWAQCITVGYERITGLRLPHQMADGTFSVSKTMTISLDAERLRAWLLDEDSRQDLFPGTDTDVRSRPGSKSVRLAIGPGAALFSIAERADGRSSVTVSHERLPTVDEVERWQFYWSEWLQALDAEASVA